MAERRVLRMGNPELYRVSEAVGSFADPGLDILISDLWDTMAARGGSGIAAPQVGVAQRVVVFGIEFHPRYPDAPPVPRTVLVNPEIEPIGEELEEDWEGCLSVPGMRGWVPRHRRIRYRGRNANGEWLEREVDGFHARLVQHECDHLDGVLYPQRIQDMTTFGFEEEISLAGLMPRPHC